MKRKLLNLIMLLLCFASVQAQDEVFPVKNASWEIAIGKVINPLESYYDEERSYEYYDYNADMVSVSSYALLELSEETRVGSLRTYNNLYECYYDSDSSLVAALLIGGLCTEGKKVYFTDDWENESLLYDFSAKVGDTIINSKRIVDSRDGTIDTAYTFSIVTKIKEGIYGEEIYVIVADGIPSWPSGFYGNIHNDIWIKGVGSKFGLFYYGTWWTTNGGGPYGQALRRMFINKNIVYPQADPGFPPTPQAIHELKISDNDFCYNQVSASLKIDLDVTSLLKLEVFNSSGVVVFSKYFNSGDHISLSSLPKGIYFCAIELGNKKIGAKKIIR